MEPPRFEDVRSRVQVFGELSRPDRSYDAFRQATGPEVDLAVPTHRDALHRWLNAWGCRIRYARAGELDQFDVAIGTWWEHGAPTVGHIDVTLAELTDAHIRRLGAAYGSLMSATVARSARGTGRTMGPTAAAKALYALLPRAVMPWDLAIAEHLHGARDDMAFSAHLALGRQWANQLLEESGLDECRLVAELGRPGSSLAKVLDEYCYVRYTLGR